MEEKIINWNLSDLKKIVLVYENCEHKTLKEEDIRKLEFKTNNDKVEDLVIVLTFESIDDEFEFFVNRKDIAQVILIKNNDEKLGPFFLEYIEEDELYLGGDNLLEDTVINVKDKEVIIFYHYNDNKPLMNMILNNNAGEKDVYQIEDMSEILKYYFGDSYLKSFEYLDGFQYRNVLLSVTETKNYYILSITNTINRKTTSALFEKNETTIPDTEVLGEYYDKELGVIVPEGKDAEDVYFEELSKE